MTFALAYQFHACLPWVNTIANLSLTFVRSSISPCLGALWRGQDNNVSKNLDAQNIDNIKSGIVAPVVWVLGYLVINNVARCKN